LAPTALFVDAVLSKLMPQGLGLMESFSIDMSHLRRYSMFMACITHELSPINHEPSKMMLLPHYIHPYSKIPIMRAAVIGIQIALDIAEHIVEIGVDIMPGLVGD
jgi:hypothetical protein